MATDSSPLRGDNSTAPLKMRLRGNTEPHYSALASAATSSSEIGGKLVASNLRFSAPMSRRRSACQVLRTRATPAPDPDDCASFSASTCISSSAKIISANGIRPQRRICSRRAPSHVVRLQSMVSVCESSVDIVVFPGTKLLDVRSILRPIGFFFHANQSEERDETD
jgi:hypothetical protein